uniref:Uncharacterized protein n=1 Tax=Anguilla anguilla TaxID=7936 RepID=A0A0E9UU42_ANGAN
MNNHTINRGEQDTNRSAAIWRPNRGNTDRKTGP